MCYIVLENYLIPHPSVLYSTRELSHTTSNQKEGWWSEGVAYSVVVDCVIFHNNVGQELASGQRSLDMDARSPPAAGIQAAARLTDTNHVVVDVNVFDATRAFTPN